MKLKAGDWVEVKSKEEILATLDKRGRLEEMPFMPQMFKYCGQQFQVYKRAHKTCDTVNPIRGRRVADAVHLNLRCDGEAYGGCQASCLLFWKVAWLRPVDAMGEALDRQSRELVVSDHAAAGATEDDVMAGTLSDTTEGHDGRRYICQATQLPMFTTKLEWWEAGIYIEDLTSGNVTLGRFIRGAIYSAYNNTIRYAGYKVGRVLRAMYDAAQSLWNGTPYPRRRGMIPVGEPTPDCNLGLQSGEFVRVKPFTEILRTLNIQNKNRGLYFDAEAVPYCGGTYRVKSRLSKFIDEKTGQLITLKKSSILLEGVWCQSRYSECRMFCPRAIYTWWREIWLERIPEIPREAARENRNRDV